MLIPSEIDALCVAHASLSRGVNANSQPREAEWSRLYKSIKRGEC